MKSVTLFLIPVLFSTQIALAQYNEMKSGANDQSGAPTPTLEEGHGYWTGGYKCKVYTDGHLELVPFKNLGVTPGCEAGANSKEVRVAYGVKDGQSSPSKSSLPSCSSVSQTAPPETICVTSEGFQFKRYQNPITKNIGWEDIGQEGKGGVGRKIWYDLKPPGLVNQKEADQFCKQNGLELPSGYSTYYNGKNNFPNRDSDFVVAESHGIREVLKDTQDKWLWSSSVYPYSYEDGAFDFDVSNGDIGDDDRDSRYDSGSARCVGVSGVNR